MVCESNYCQQNINPKFELARLLGKEPAKMTHSQFEALDLDWSTPRAHELIARLSHQAGRWVNGTKNALNENPERVAMLDNVCLFNRDELTDQSEITLNFFFYVRAKCEISRTCTGEPKFETMYDYVVNQTLAAGVASGIRDFAQTHVTTAAFDAARDSMSVVVKNLADFGDAWGGADGKEKAKKVAAEAVVKFNNTYSDFRTIMTTLVQPAAAAAGGTAEGGTTPGDGTTSANQPQTIANFYLNALKSVFIEKGAAAFGLANREKWDFYDGGGTLPAVHRDEYSLYDTGKQDFKWEKLKRKAKFESASDKCTTRGPVSCPLVVNITMLHRKIMLAHKCCDCSSWSHFLRYVVQSEVCCRGIRMMHHDSKHSHRQSFIFTPADTESPSRSLPPNRYTGEVHGHGRGEAV